METRTPESKCPVCGHILDAATSINGEFEPRPGDVTLCVQCGEILIFNKDLRGRIPTAEEKLQYGDMPEVIVAQIFIRGWKQ